MVKFSRRPGRRGTTYRAAMLRRRWPPRYPEPVPNPITGLVYCVTLKEWGVVCEGHEPLTRRSNA